MKHNEQLEISLESKKNCRRPFRTRARRVRARWWFEQMRAVVEQATDWKNCSSGHGEQTYLNLNSEKR